MSLEEKKRLLTRRAAERAYKKLREEISEIRYVGDWAMKTNCSRTKLLKVIKAHYKITPKEMLRKTRYEMIKDRINDNPEINSYVVAVENGLKNEKELFKFLNRNFDTNFSKLRFKILIEREDQKNDLDQNG